MVAPLAIAFAIFLQTSPSLCAVDRDAELAQDVKAFDQTPGKGWRALAHRKGCESAAADLIAAYRQHHAAAIVELRPNILIMLNFHEAQLRAAANETDRAIALQKRAMTGEGLETSYYNEAMLAFLRKDLNALKLAREELASVPRPDWMPEGKGKWPPNLDVVDGLINCFGKPYSEAYSQACRLVGK